MSKRSNAFDYGHVQTKNAEQTKTPCVSPNKPVGNDKKSEIVSIRKRSTSLLSCVVCGNDALGYNFDAITCESCKAFFRRNALTASDNLKCRGNGHCGVTVNIVKRCRKCRLERCHQSGMRKEWILSNAETTTDCILNETECSRKNKKQHKIQENRRLKEIQENRLVSRIRSNQQQLESISELESLIDGDFSWDFLSRLIDPPLSPFEWFQIQSIQNTYTTAVHSNPVTGASAFPLVQSLQSTLELLRFPLFVSSMRLISFLKQITEFEQLNVNDQVYLIKLNLIVLSFFHSMFLYDPTTNTYHEQDSTDPFYSAEDWTRTFNEQFHADIQRLRDDFLRLFPSSDIMIKLSFLILIFSNRLSSNEGSQCSTINTHSLGIFRAQNVFTDLLYKYCIDQHGSVVAPVMFTRYVSKLMKLQALIDEIRFNIDDYVDTTQLPSLMNNLLL